MRTSTKRSSYFSSAYSIRLPLLRRSPNAGSWTRSTTLPVREHPRATLGSLTKEAVSNSITVYMRYITAAEIKTSPNYAPFLFNPDFGNEMDPIEFCNCFVDPIGVEAGNSAPRLCVQCPLTRHHRPGADYRTDNCPSSRPRCGVPRRS